MSARKFAKDGDWAEISEMSNRSLRKIIYEFAEEYHKSQVNKNESISLVSDSDCPHPSITYINSKWKFFCVECGQSGIESDR